MSDSLEIPHGFASNGHTWKYHSYDNGNRHQWYRAMTDAEVREHTNGRIDGVDDIDVTLTWPIADYPVYMIELHHIPSSGEYTVVGNRTYLGSPRPGMTDAIGPKYRVETSKKNEAIRAVREFARSLS